MFGHAVLEAIEVKGRPMLNFEILASKVGKFGCQPKKGKADLYMKKGFKFPIFLSVLFFLKEAILLHKE